MSKSNMFLEFSQVSCKLTQPVISIGVLNIEIINQVDNSSSLRAIHEGNLKKDVGPSLYNLCLNFYTSLCNFFLGTHYQA